MMIYRFLVTVILFLLGGLAFASQASAGDYNVIACHASNDSSKSNAFTAFQNGSGWTNNGQGDCMGAFNMIYVGRINNSVIPVQSWTAGSAGFTLAAPADTGFTAIAFDWYLESQGWGNRCIQAGAAWAYWGGYCHNVGSPSGGTSPGGGQPSDPIAIDWHASSETFSQSSSATLSVRCTSVGSQDSAGCDGSTPFGSSTSTNTLTGYFKNISVQLHDPTAPSLIDGGGLWGQTGWVSGNWDLSWNATDSMGVKRHRFLVDDVETGAGASFCNLPSYLGRYYGPKTKPCPSKDESGYQGASFTVDTAALADGQRTLKIQSYDATDNIGEASTTIKVDNSVPSNVTPAGISAWTNDTTPEFTLSATDSQSGVAGYECKTDTGSWSACVSPYTTPTLSEGVHSFCSKAYDNSASSSGAANYSAADCSSFTVSTTPPTAAILAPASYLNQSGVLQGSASDSISGLAAVKFQARKSGSLTWIDLCDLAPAGSSYSCPLESSSLSDGSSYSFRVQASNNAGSVTSSALAPAIVDFTAPTGPQISSGPSNNGWISSNSATYAFSSTDATSGLKDYQCRIDGSVWGVCASPQSFLNLSEGTHNIDFRAQDNVNNVSSVSSLVLGVDRTRPTVAFDAAKDYISGTVSLSGQAIDTLSGIASASLQIKPAGGAYQQACSSVKKDGNNYSCLFDTSSLSDGVYTLRLMAEDRAGNQPVEPPTQTVILDNSGPVINLTRATRFPVWTVTDSLSGINPDGFTAEFSLDGGSVYQPFNVPAFSNPTYQASLPKSVPAGTTVLMRLLSFNQAGARTASLSSFVVPSAPPINASLPSISGTSKVNQVFTGVGGGWSGIEDISTSFAWLRCSIVGEDCEEIASGPYYSLDHGDANHRLRLRESATNSDGQAFVVSNKSNVIAGLPAAASALPLISGSVKSGEELSNNSGAWLGTGPFDYDYQWQRCDDNNTCADIAGASLVKYELTNADVSKHVRVRVTASNESILEGGTATQTSEVTDKVSAIVAAGTLPPTVSGSSYDGQLLSATDGAWSGSRPLLFSYQWQACNGAGDNCSNIENATESSFLTSHDLIGKTLRVRVFASNAALTGGAVASQTSAPSEVIASSLASNVSLPILLGGHRVGDALAVSNGDWLGRAPFEFSYQWQRCDSNNTCLDLDGQTTGTYTLALSDSGQRVRALVKATNSAGATTIESAPTAPVTRSLAPPANSQLPTISGVNKVSSILRLTSPGVWSGYGTISYSYQWQRCSASNCLSIRAADNTSYVVSDDDIGQQIRLQVTASGEDGIVAVSSSPGEKIVSIKPYLLSKPLISGSNVEGSVLSALAGSWEGDGPITRAHRWLRCRAIDDCYSIASGDSLTLTSGDVGSYIQLQEQASNQYGSALTSSSMFGPIIKGAKSPINTRTPALSGSAQIGGELTTSPGSWEGDGPMSYSYQWFRCIASCEAIKGATRINYQPTAADINARLQAKTIATGPSGSGEAFGEKSEIVTAPSCLKVDKVASKKASLAQNKIIFSGSPAGSYGPSKPLLLKASASKSKMNWKWTLDGGLLVAGKKLKKSLVTITTDKILPSQHKLILAVTSLPSKKTKSKTIKITVTIKSSACLLSSASSEAPDKSPVSSPAGSLSGLSSLNIWKFESSPLDKF